MKATKAVLDQGRGSSLSEIQFIVKSEEESNLLNEDVKCFLIEEFRHNIKFSELERKNESQFVLLLAIKVEGVINSLHNIYALKSPAEVIKQSLLEFDYNLDGSFVTHTTLQTILESNESTWPPGVLYPF